MHAGYVGWSDEALLQIPYARLMQEVRLAAEAFERDQQNAWIQSAFIGWQVMGSMGGKVGSFQKYLRKMGLQPKGSKVTPEQVAADKAKAFEALKLVEARFDRGAA